MSVSDSVERVPEVSHGRTDKDGLTKMNSPSDINSRNATPAGGHNESTSSQPVSPDLSVPAPQPNPSTGLDLDEIEADFADPGVVGLRKLGTVGTGPLCRLVAAVPALVAEVRRLRERLDEERRGAERLSQWYNAAQAERDAARAEAERLRVERNIAVNAVASRSPDFDVRALAIASRQRDEANRNAAHWKALLGETRTELSRTEGDLAVAVAEAARVREALQAIRKLHQQAEYPDDSFCFACGFGWPCETARALDAALDGAE